MKLLVKIGLLTFGLGLSVQWMLAQVPPGALEPNPAAPGQRSPAPTAEGLRPTYVLRSGDQIMIRSTGIEEISNRPYRIDSEGKVTLPILGPVQAAGRTVEQFERFLIEQLRTYFVDPQLMVTITQFASEPVFVVGAFRSPGIYPLQGRRTLIELLTSVGGLTPNASRRITVTRKIEYGRIPLPNATESADGTTTSVEISLASLRDNINPAEDIPLAPYDIITANRAEMVFVQGEVARVGGFELGERDSITISQIVSMAGGLGRDAKPDKAVVLRPVLDSTRRAAIPVNVKRILAGKDPDFPLLPNDMLYIPTNTARIVRNRVLLFTVPPAILLLFRQTL